MKTFFKKYIVLTLILLAISGVLWIKGAKETNAQLTPNLPNISSTINKAAQDAVKAAQEKIAADAKAAAKAKAQAEAEAKIRPDWKTAQDKYKAQPNENTKKNFNDAYQAYQGLISRENDAIEKGLSNQLDIQTQALDKLSGKDTFAKIDKDHQTALKNAADQKKRAEEAATKNFEKIKKDIESSKDFDESDKKTFIKYAEQLKKEDLDKANSDYKKNKNAANETHKNETEKKLTSIKNSPKIKAIKDKIKNIRDKQAQQQTKRKQQEANAEVDRLTTKSDVTGKASDKNALDLAKARKDVLDKTLEYQILANEQERLKKKCTAGDCNAKEKKRFKALEKIVPKAQKDMNDSKMDYFREAQSQVAKEKFDISVFSITATKGILEKKIKEEGGLGGLVTGIMKVAIYSVGLLAILGICIGGITLIISAGNENMVQNGKTTLFYSILGLILVIFSYAIITTVQTIVYGIATS